MLTEKDYCDYDTCVALEELGFNTKCHGYYESLKRCFNTTSIKRCWCNSEVNDIGIVICPTLYEAQKWLREEKGIFVCIDVPWKTNDGLGWNYSCCNKPMTDEDKEVCFASEGFYDSYEEALLEGLRASIKILKEK